MSELIGPHFSVSTLKVLWTEILRHSLNFNLFCMNEEYFSHNLEISTNSRRGAKFWGEAILQNVGIIWSTLLYFNLKTFMEATSSSFITVQSFLHESAVLLPESWNFYKLKRGDLVSVGNLLCRMSELFCPPFSVSILQVF